jgi:ABC-type amino acid transport substrate-binding protein
MKNSSSLLLSAAIAAIVSFGVINSTSVNMQPATSTAVSQTGVVSQRQSVYERVVTSGVLRCGTFDEAPFTTTDANRGTKTGIAVDLAQTVAAELGVKLEWVDVSNFGTLTEDLKQGKYDAICASVFNLPRKGQIDYTAPYAFVPLYAYTLKGRTEFDNALDTLDWSKVTIAGVDGEGSTTIAQKKLPNAKFNNLPQLTNIGELLNSVVTQKADLVFVTPTVFKNFNTTNPDLLQKVAAEQPFHIFSVSFAIKPNESAFKNTLDIIIRNLSVSGELVALFKKHDPEGLLFQPAMSYNKP